MQIMSVSVCVCVLMCGRVNDTMDEGSSSTGMCIHHSSIYERVLDRSLGEINSLWHHKDLALW